MVHSTMYILGYYAHAQGVRRVTWVLHAASRSGASFDVSTSYVLCAMVARWSGPWAPIPVIALCLCDVKGPFPS